MGIKCSAYLHVIYCLLCPVNCNPSHQTVKLYGTCITWYSFCLLSSIMNFLPPRTMTRVPPNILSNTMRLCIVLIQSAAGYWRKCDDSLPCSTLIRGPEVALRPVDTSCSILTWSRCKSKTFLLRHDVIRVRALLLFSEPACKPGGRWLPCRRGCCAPPARSRRCAS